MYIEKIEEKKILCMYIKKMKIPIEHIATICNLSEEYYRNGNREIFEYADEEGILKIYDSRNCYLIEYLHFKYGNIYTKKLYIYKSFVEKCIEMNGLYFKPYYLTCELKGRKTLTKKEKKEREKYFENLNTAKSS